MAVLVHGHSDRAVAQVPLNDGGMSTLGNGKSYCGVVGSDRGAVRAFRLVRFLGPPAEPDVRVPTHPALPEAMPLS